MLEIDQQKLSTRNKIIPLDGEFIYYNFFKNNEYCVFTGKDRYDRQMHMNNNKTGQALTEEFVVGDIKNLHLYILQINLLFSKNYRNLSGYEKIEIYKIVRNYSKKYKILLKVEPGVMKDLIDVYRRKEHVEVLGTGLSIRDWF